MKIKIQELKKILKPLVKECINEVLAEQFLRTVSEAQRPAAHKSAYAEVMEQHEPEQRKPSIKPAQQKNKSTPIKEDISKEELRAKLRAAVKDDDVMVSMYEDSLQRTVPLQEKDTSHGVSEDLMEQMGAFRHNFS